jgi:2-(1,2-epoxy-1,2-dihydrophenyl)acetyl-CoA isomerase
VTDQTSAPAHIEVTEQQEVAVITLRRPEALNALSAEMRSNLAAALRRYGDGGPVRGIVLTGTGRGFCAGQDLAEAMPKDGAMPDLGDFVRDTWNPLVLGIRTLEKPVVCAVNGTAAGAGANLAFMCDIVFAAREVNFIQSFSKIGVIPDTGGTFILPRLIGLQRATVLTMLADKLPAEQAQAWGLIHKVCDAATLQEEALACAKHLATQPTRALGLIKRGFNRSLGVDLATQLKYEEELQREAGKAADYAEGVKAFLEKRKPNFTGQ